MIYLSTADNKLYDTTSSREICHLSVPHSNSSITLYESSKHNYWTLEIDHSGEHSTIAKPVSEIQALRLYIDMYYGAHKADFPGDAPTIDQLQQAFPNATFDIA